MVNKSDGVKGVRVKRLLSFSSDRPTDPVIAVAHSRRDTCSISATPEKRQKP